MRDAGAERSARLEAGLGTDRILDGDGTGASSRSRGTAILVVAIGLGLGVLLVAAILLLQDTAITLPLLLAVLLAILLAPAVSALLTLRLVRALDRADPAAAADLPAADAAVAAPVALAVTDRDGMILFANRQMMQVAAAECPVPGISLPACFGLAAGAAEPTPAGFGGDPGPAGQRLRLLDGRGAVLTRMRLPHPDGRLLWHLSPEDPSAPQSLLSALALSTAPPDAGEIRLLHRDPLHRTSPDGDVPSSDGDFSDPAPGLPALWRDSASAGEGGATGGGPTWRAVGLWMGADRPRLWLQHVATAVADADGAAGDSALPAGLADLPVGAALLGPGGGVIAANSAFASLSGWRAGTAATMSDLVAMADREILHQVLSAGPAAAGEEPATLHFAGNPERSVHLVAGPVEGPPGPRLILALDVTAQKGVEQQFAHGQKMQAIGQLAGGVAHDFNNLLTAMIGFCDLLLQRHPPTDQSFADVQQIKQNALRAAGLVRQLLAFSRRQTLRPRPLDVGDVLADLRHLISRLIGERIRLSIVHGRNLGIVRVDRGQLEQVIINLAVNARDAMRDGGSLSITTGAEEVTAAVDRGNDRVPAGRYVRIDVADTGTGVPAEHADKIFDPFFTTKKQGEGTGLGLSTVYGIIRQTGGFVFLDRNGPAGATFSILLPETSPDIRDAAGADGADGARAERPPVPRDLTGRETLLLVEDEDAVRLFAARSLRNKGYTVMEASSGEAALELSRAFGGPIHALVTDVVMPNMDGPSLAQEVLRDRPGMAVVFMSGYAEDAVRQALSGGDVESSFLQKPFTLNDLAVTVRAALSGAESARWPSKS